MNLDFEEILVMVQNQYPESNEQWELMEAYCDQLGVWYPRYYDWKYRDGFDEYTNKINNDYD